MNFLNKKVCVCVCVCGGGGGGGASFCDNEKLYDVREMKWRMRKLSANGASCGTQHLCDCVAHYTNVFVGFCIFMIIVPEPDWIFTVFKERIDCLIDLLTYWLIDLSKVYIPGPSFWKGG